MWFGVNGLRRHKRGISLFVSLLMFLGMTLPAALGSQTEKSLSGTITVVSGPDVMNATISDGQTLNVISNWVVKFSAYHSNWTCMNHTGSSTPNITLVLYNDYGGGTLDSSDDNKTKYTFAIYPANPSTDGYNGWEEIGPNTDEVNLISCTNTSNASLTTVGNDPVMYHFELTFKFSPTARFANSTPAVGQWHAAVKIQDNSSATDVYDNTTDLYNSYYAQIDIDDTTWGVTLRPGQGLTNESETHVATYTCNYLSVIEGKGDIFNHSSGYGANKYIKPGNISIALTTGASTVLNDDKSWKAMDWANNLDIGLNATLSFRHRVTLATAPNIAKGTYTGNTYLKIRQKAG